VTSPTRWQPTDFLGDQNRDAEAPYQVLLDYFTVHSILASSSMARGMLS
jgi:hypothetical protein